MSTGDDGRVWVLSSSTPSAAAGNGKHYKNCPTFQQPARRGTEAELAALPPCSKCGPDQASSTALATCPQCHLVLTPAGLCPDHGPLR